MSLSRLAIETAIILLVGGILAFVANAISPRGLHLGRDYFPPPAAVPDAPSVPSLPVTRNLEFPAFSLDEILEITHDVRFATRQILIIDARNAESHQAGHIPGSLHLDPFRPERTLASVLPGALAAQKIIIYCGGGDCEDSHLAARLLRDIGVPVDRLAIYEGGFNEWQATGQPIQSP